MAEKEVMTALDSMFLSGFDLSTEIYMKRASVWSAFHGYNQKTWQKQHREGKVYFSSRFTDSAHDLLVALARGWAEHHGGRMWQREAVQDMATRKQRECSTHRSKR